ncbi:hypothetical protein AVEN_144095-1 [Araneus ventricosus]|uniref:Uncharacterized protein n=1 Tax=Araneus ventricosus TaxID=182803 RepID=A0A4Y2QY74_ARAVE|nr:hypothetical protein AVEN_144095-1 [Araneus ventricosus]
MAVHTYIAWKQGSCTDYQCNDNNIQNLYLVLSSPEASQIAPGRSFLKVVSNGPALTCRPSALHIVSAGRDAHGMILAHSWRISPNRVYQEDSTTFEIPYFVAVT